MQKANKYRTVLVIVSALLVFYFWRGSEWFLYSALIIGISGFLVPPVAEWINAFWFGLAKVLGWINSRILLSIVFFLILWPLSMLRKLFQPKAKESSTQSYYVIRNHIFTKKDLENTW